MLSMQDIITGLVGFIGSILLFNYKQDKKKLDLVAKECAERDAAIAQRLVVVETELMTEREVRDILREVLGPLTAKVDHVAENTNEIKLQLARIPKRADD